MSLPERAAFLQDCYFHEPHPNPFEIKVERKRLKKSADSFGYPPDVVDRSKRFFSVSEVDICDICEDRPSYCTHNAGKETIEEWTLEIEQFVKQEWAEWFKENTSFGVGDVEKRPSGILVLECEVDSVKVDFLLFTTERQASEYTFSDEAPEFGIGFLHPDILEGLSESERIFAWTEPLEDRFESSADEKLDDFFGTSGNRLLNVDQISTKKSVIISSIQEYLNKIGYDPQSNIGSSVREANRHRIPVSERGLTAGIRSDDEKVVLCECDLVNDLHIHRFSGGKLTDAEESPELSHLIDEVNRLSDSRADLDSTINSLSKMSSWFSAVAALTGILSLFGNTDELLNYLVDDLGLDFIDPTVGFILLLVTIGVLLFVGLFSLSVFILEWRFDWEIVDYVD
ncbi:hypothetical protein Natpe_2807 [Natrinema pellirubrum DSM 15624]|uniref:Uncharacterized protein n=2 Tax=Natrinema pellirubrum (strain DSM 15624 / CIP 106293 / JCM 10476 / NCIMB 786 / 157) TaxID=797303 RepID=L0JQE3_NATP1|nr:hypothetical protein [Natrinema pellirubrum]AGB32606.1 hypothetical protein Natpe_2807 [Natrinema pellirubrum DSM 15624]